jgi:hypothetical protein
LAEEGRPDIAQFLQDASSHSDLLDEWIKIDWNYRLKAGESPAIDQYRNQFPTIFSEHPHRVDSL